MKEARNKSIPPKEHHIVIVQLGQEKFISKIKGTRLFWLGIPITHAIKYLKEMVGHHARFKCAKSESMSIVPLVLAFDCAFDTLSSCSEWFLQYERCGKSYSGQQPPGYRAVCSEDPGFVWPLLLTCCGGCACWSRVAKLDCVVFVGADGLVAGNYS